MMSSELIFILTLVSRMAIVAALVVTASFITERFGPAIGALIASLPISAGPSFVFLALDHDSAFIAASALASLPVNAATIFLLLTYAVLAQRHGMAIATSASVAVWLVLAFIVRQFEWTLAGGLAVNAITFAICIPLLQPYRHLRGTPLIMRRWYDVPLRALLVATLVATVVTTSGWVGPRISGTIALFPIAFTAMILIFHPRMGGPPTAALIANGGWGMMGYGAAVATLHVGAQRFGSATGLGLALLISLCWNFALWRARPRTLAR
jgi:hypothetical protein